MCKIRTANAFCCALDLEVRSDRIPLDMADADTD